MNIGSSDGFGSLGSTSMSSEENSSPNSTPKSSRPPLRLTLSTGSASQPSLDNHISGSIGNMCYPKKGILKSSSSYGSLDSASTTSILMYLVRRGCGRGTVRWMAESPGLEVEGAEKTSNT